MPCYQTLNLTENFYLPLSVGVDLYLSQRQIQIALETWIFGPAPRFYTVDGSLAGLLCPVSDLIDIKHFFRPPRQREAYAMPEVFCGASVAF